jgi:DNA modification methylase
MSYTQIQVNMSETLEQKSNVKSRVLKTEMINWRELKFIQNDNFKDLPEEAKHKLKASIVSNNFTQPFYVWEDFEGTLWCLDGKHRTVLLEELIKEGMEVPYQLPGTFIHCDNKKEASKLVLIYSSMYAKITQEGLFDFMKFNELVFEELKDQVQLPEFSMPRFEQKFNPMGFDLTQEEEEIEVVQENIVVKSGDLFQLGNHRLICGSCLDEKIVSELMNGEKSRIIFTDPPYNLKANEFSNKGEVKHEDFAMGGGEMTDEEFKDFIKGIMKTSCDNSVNGSIHYICMDFRHMWHMSEAARLVYGSVIPKQLVVWNKNNGANGSFYRAKHELVFIYKNGTDRHLSHLELVDRIRYNVWDYPNATAFNNPDRKELQNHPTPKPVQMVADAILDTTNEGDLVIDWFMGSGTTIIASEMTKRRCYGTEIMPGYVQSDIKRYLKYCEKNGIVPNFKHLNGDLTAEDFN